MGEPEAPPIVEIVNDVVLAAIACTTCGHSLLGLKTTDQCPGCKAQVGDSLGTRSIDDACCIQCGYYLRGLQPDGVCPECGTPVERSLRGNGLKYSSIEYVRSLRRGAWMILAAIIIQILLGVGGFVLGAVLVASSGSAGLTTAIQWGLQGLGMVAAFMSLYGWWLFSELDPAYSGRDQGTTSRKVVRWAVAIAAAQTMVSFSLQAFPSMQGGGAPGVFTGAMAIVSLGVAAVKFFASMLYVRWLAPRLPNTKVYRRAKTLMWLGPVLMTFGWLLVGLGPLIALILYWNMIYWMYKDLKQIDRDITFEGASAVA